MHRFSVGALALVFSSAAHAQMFVRIFTRRRRRVAGVELVCKCFCVETTTRRAAVVVYCMCDTRAPIIADVHAARCAGVVYKAVVVKHSPTQQIPAFCFALFWGACHSGSICNEASCCSAERAVFENIYSVAYFGGHV